MTQMRLSHQPNEFIGPGRNQYRIVEPIQAGGMGTVYRAINVLTGTHYAVKECDLLDDPRGQQISRAEAVQIFIRESSCLEQLDHPGIPRGFLVVDPQDDLRICLACGNRVQEDLCSVCPVGHGLGTTQTIDNRYYLFMEYIEGRDLEALALDFQRPISEQDARQLSFWMAETARILQYLHDQKLVHRDIKPANIRIREEDGRLFLLDFGLLLLERGDAKTKMLQPRVSLRLGTEGYAAPEQIQGDPCEATDIFALTITLAELFSGLDPANPLAKQRILGFRNEALFSQLNPRLHALLTSALAANPTDRPSAAFFAATLAEEPLLVPRVPMTMVERDTGHVSLPRQVEPQRLRRIGKVPLLILALPVMLFLIWYGLPTEKTLVLQGTARSGAPVYNHPETKDLITRLSGGEKLQLKDAGPQFDGYWLKIISMDESSYRGFIQREQVEIRIRKDMVRLTFE